MARKRTLKQQLVDLYDKAIKENISNRWVVHCTDSKRVVEAAQQGADEEYRNAIKLFKATLDDTIEDDYGK